MKDSPTDPLRMPAALVASLRPSTRNRLDLGKVASVLSTGGTRGTGGVG